MTQLSGKVKWYDSKKAFGFVISNGRDYFVHRKCIKSGEDILLEGQTVTFTPKPGTKGEQASELRVIEANGNVCEAIDHWRPEW